MAYGGSFGTGLLSRAPMDDRDVLVFASTVNARGALYTRITSSLGLMHVFAVHFSPGPEDEQRPQVERLLRWMHDKTASRAQSTIVIGDLNMTPGSRLFRRFEEAGFTSPYARAANAKCTFCHGAFTASGHGTSGILIDHVLVRGFAGTTLAERVLDAPIAIATAGQPIRTTYSDHCGVRVTLRT